MNKTIKKRQQKDKKTLIENLEKTPIIQMACEKTGISRATYYRWRIDDREFEKNADKALDDGVSLMNDYAESQLISSIRDKNMTAIIYWLKHRHRAYSTKLEISGSLEHKNVEISEEYKELIKKALNLSLPEGEIKNGRKQSK